MIVHQSDLKTYDRCGELHRRQLNGERGGQLSATAYGSVMHHALHILERNGDLQLALNTFTYYWNPLNIDVVCEPVDIWIGNQSYGSLLAKGLDTLKNYAEELAVHDGEEVLALEIPFVVELEGTLDRETGRPHELAGTIDRLAIRYYQRKPYVCVDDWKTGRKPSYLKHAIQFTGYAYATTKPEFWVGNPEHLTVGFGPVRGRALSERTEKFTRRGYWISLLEGRPKWSNAGNRYHQDYLRFLHSVDTYVRARQAEIFPLKVDGSTCEFCPFRDDCPQGLLTPSQPNHSEESTR